MIGVQNMGEPNYFTDAYRATAKGREYVYAWRGKGAPRLPGAFGSEESLSAWLSAISIRKLGLFGTLTGLIDDFKKTPRWLGTAGRKSYSDSTKRGYEHYLKSVDKQFGDLALVALEDRRIRADILDWRDEIGAKSPRNADYCVQLLSIVINFGMASNRLAINHALKIEKLYESDRSAFIWLPEDIAALEEAASPEVFRAAKLAALTGFRKTDLMALQWSQIGPKRIIVDTSKSRGRRMAIVPRYPELNTFLETLPRTGDTVLVNSRGEPWKAFSASWQTAHDSALAKIKDPQHRARFAELHFHDLRGTAATKLYQIGLSELQMAKWLGWQVKTVTALIERYVDDNAASNALAEKLGGALNENGSAKPFAKLAANDG
jgi:integrase